MSNRLTSLVLGGAACLLAVPACDLDIPDLNNPGLDQLQNNPTPGTVNAAATGMLASNRTGKATATGYVNQLGVLGRESYDFDANDGRFVSELIQGTLQKGSPFGGIFWGANYGNIRNGNIILHALDKLVIFDNPDNVDTQKSAMRGFVHTMQALEFLTVLITHYDTGLVIDVDHPLGDPLGPIVPKADVYKEIIRLLELGQTELLAGGKEFTFALSPGFAGFDTPATFAQFNRALRARVAVYTEDYATAATILTTKDVTFIDEDPKDLPASLKTGVSYSFSTGAGDQLNGLFNRKSVYAHPALQTDVEMKPDPADATGMKKVPDARYSAKIKLVVDADGKPQTVTNSNDDTLTTPITFNIYTSASSSIPIIRNEDLILLKAEALWFTGDHAGAIADLDFVHVNSGKLPTINPPDPTQTPQTTPITDDATFIQALLYERRYSLLYEGGHRWIDLRRFHVRFGTELPLDDPDAHKRNYRYPIPQAECDARPGEAACGVKSTDPVAN